MIRFFTSGESHGKSLTAIAEGFPSNIPITEEYINKHLKRRQIGFGRGYRMKIESDNVEINSGVRFGKTIGSPISLIIKNNDWKNWIVQMSVENQSEKSKKISIPRPGHADLVGTVKYNFNDIRNSIERSSARETAARVAACSIARKFLEEFGIYIGSYVESIGGIFSKENYLSFLFQNKFQKNFNGLSISEIADKSEVRTLNPNQEKKIINKINLAKKKGDTLGGTFVVIATGVPIGLGSFMHFDRRLDADISFSLMSINAVKGVEIGNGFKSSLVFGSNVQDEISFNGKDLIHTTNFCGGIEGGISNGEPIILRAAMKPISTLMNPLNSVELKTFKNVKSRIERSDVAAVPACAVVAESMLAWILAKHFLIKFGGDSIEETKENYFNYKKNLLKKVRKNFK